FLCPAPARADDAPAQQTPATTAPANAPANTPTDTPAAPTAPASADAPAAAPQTDAPANAAAPADAAAPAADAGPPKAGELTEAKGQIRAKRGADPERALVQGNPVYAEDDLATGPEDKGRVTFADGSSLDIGPDSRVLLADFVYDPANIDASKQAIRMAKGMFRYVSGKVVQNDPARLRLESPLAVIGIRGTTLDHKIVTEVKTVKGVQTETVKEELHALRATKQSQVVVDQHGLKSVLTKPDQAVFLRPKLPGSVRALTDQEKAEFATIPPTPAP
ncbi:MAG: hypothetical protein B193_3992, partial [Solidesulfovibrio magneticus str. Maddingley MBC34]